MDLLTASSEPFRSSLTDSCIDELLTVGLLRIEPKPLPAPVPFFAWSAVRWNVVLKSASLAALASVAMMLGAWNVKHSAQTTERVAPATVAAVEPSLLQTRVAVPVVVESPVQTPAEQPPQTTPTAQVALGSSRRLAQRSARVPSPSGAMNNSSATHSLSGFEVCRANCAGDALCLARCEVQRHEVSTPSANVSMVSATLESPSEDSVRNWFSRTRTALDACANGKHGVTTLEATFASTGRVTTTTVSGAFAGSSEGSCMALALRSAGPLPAFSRPLFRASFRAVF